LFEECPEEIARDCFDSVSKPPRAISSGRLPTPPGILSENKCFDDNVFFIGIYKIEQTFDFPLLREATQKV